MDAQALINLLALLGRLQGTLASLEASHAEKDTFIEELTARNAELETKLARQ